MPHADFVHLRVHSAYSLSEGAIKVKELIGLCKAEKMPAVAMVDTGNVFGALEFCSAASEAGVQPILGCQVAIRHEAEGMRHLRAPEPSQLVLLVQRPEGYANLIRLVSEAFLDTPPGDPLSTRLALAEELRQLGNVDGARALLDEVLAQADGILVKGNEAGGFVGEDASFILMQKWLKRAPLPLYLRDKVALTSRERASGAVSGGAASGTAAGAGKVMQ